VVTAVSSVRDALAAAVAALESAGCQTPRLDAELLIADALGVDRSVLISTPGMDIPAGPARVIGERVRRRIAREPVAYILGRKGFRYIELAVDARVLIPRAETELLVEVALELPPDAAVHDVGTGSGAIALALLDERPDLRVSASDASPEAIDVVAANAARLGLVLELEVRSGMPDGVFDMVLANLPYVADGEWPSLAPEISRYEPREALLGGADGLDPIRELVGQAPVGALLALEHAPHQAEAVRDLFESDSKDSASVPNPSGDSKDSASARNPSPGSETRRDLAGHERVTVGRVP